MRPVRVMLTAAPRERRRGQRARQPRQASAPSRTDGGGPERPGRAAWCPEDNAPRFRLTSGPPPAERAWPLAQGTSAAARDGGWGRDFEAGMFGLVAGHPRAGEVPAGCSPAASCAIASQLTSSTGRFMRRPRSQPTYLQLRAARRLEDDLRLELGRVRAPHLF